MNDRACIACAWLNRNGCFLPAVWLGANHWSPRAEGEVAYVTRTRSALAGMAMCSALPNAGVAGSSVNVVAVHEPDPAAVSTVSIFRSRVSRTTSVAFG